MKRIFLILIPGLALAGTAAEPESVVRFSNNDLLTGELESLTADRLVWKSPLLEKPSSFFLKSVLDLSLPAVRPESKADHEATLTLTNGDTVRGQLASVTDEIVSLDTWFAGRVNFNRLMVSGLTIEGNSAILYRGPTGLDGWKQSGKKLAWTYGGGAFVSQGIGSIAKENMLPDECSVSFDMAKRGDSFALKVILFSDEPTMDDTSSGYEFQIRRGTVSLRSCKNSDLLGSSQSQALAENDKVRVDLRASRKSGKICFYVNDKLVDVWTDPDVAKAKFGSCLHFVTENAQPVRISGIAVADWDGLAPTPEPRVGFRQFGLQGMRDDPKPTSKEKPKEGRMELANGDSVEGEVTSIQDGIIAVKTALGDIEIPAARLRTVALKKVDLERCIRRNGDIRAWFPDDSSLVFRLDAVSDGALIGSSQNFGSATFKISAFSRIEFNIYDPDLDERRVGSDW